MQRLQQLLFPTFLVLAAFAHSCHTTPIFVFLGVNQVNEIMDATITEVTPVWLCCTTHPLPIILRHINMKASFDNPLSPLVIISLLLLTAGLKLVCVCAAYLPSLQYGFYASAGPLPVFVSKTVRVFF